MPIRTFPFAALSPILAIVLVLLMSQSSHAAEHDGKGFGAAARSDGSIVGDAALADGPLAARIFGGYSNQAWSFEGATSATRQSGFEGGVLVGYRSRFRKETYVHFSGIASYAQTYDGSGEVTVAWRNLGANLSFAIWPTERLEIMITPVEVVSSSGYVKAARPSIDFNGWRVDVMRSLWVTYYFE